MLRIGVVSDTHGLLRPEVEESLAGCDRILHAGDVDRAFVLDCLELIAPVRAVRGNNDARLGELPDILEFEEEDFRFCMIHDRKQLPRVPEGTDIVVFGHTHRFLAEERDGIFWLNPGTCGPCRFGAPVTWAILTLDRGTLQVQKHRLPEK